MVTKDRGCVWNRAWWECRAAWWYGEVGDSKEWCREEKGIGRERMGGVEWLLEVPIAGERPE